ncbi:MAG: HAD hydrolase family protein [Atopobiaceae bacterium]|nr:HAD hydrolase family protein [Atopobiaceae bacterium]
MAEEDQGPVVAFFDVDGTLTSREFNDGLHVVPAAGVQEAIRAFVAAGNVAVVMGNARENVKAHADYVTDDVRDDGVVTALSHFGLI